MYCKIIIAGHLGRDPEMRYTPQGTPVTNFSVAVNRRRKDGEDVTVWFKVAVWGSQAEACNEYLAKGRQVLLEGTLQADHATGGPKVFTRNDGTCGAAFEVAATVVKFLGGRGAVAEDEEPVEEHQAELPF